MKSICKTKSIHGSDFDIISDLPCNIIENILVCLPLHDVVRTSMLSRKWRFKWVTIPELNFNDLCSKHSGQLLSDTHKLVTMIYQVLIHHKGPIVKFVLSNLGKESFVHINHWIIFLSRNDIQDFTLRIMWGGEYYRLPIHFYSFLQLRHLNLFKCVFNPPPTFKGFSSLVSIDFHSVIVATDILLNLISSCRLLERLGLADCNKFECLDIDAPKLRSLRFFGGSNTFCLKNSPHLAMAMVDLYGMTEKVHLVEGEASNFIKVFGCTIVLENLLICAGFLKVRKLHGFNFVHMPGTSCFLHPYLLQVLGCMKCTKEASNYPAASQISAYS